MIQYEINNKEVILKVSKSPFLVRGIMFLFSFLFFTMPLVGVFLSIFSGNGVHLGSFIGVGVFGLMGFYMLRISLWNTYGFESISIDKQKITYEANYRWFKDGRKVVDRMSVHFLIKKIGYEEDNKGVLVIKKEDYSIECVTKMPIDQLEKLIEEINETTNNHT